MTNHDPATLNGYHTVTPYLTVAGADQLIRFMTRVFGAQQSERINSKKRKMTSENEIGQFNNAYIQASLAGDVPNHTSAAAGLTLLPRLLQEGGLQTITVSSHMIILGAVAHVALAADLGGTRGFATDL